MSSRSFLGIVLATLILFAWGMLMHVGLHEGLEAITIMDVSQEDQVVEMVQEPGVTLPDGVYMGSRGIFLVVNTLADGTNVLSGLSFPMVLIVQLIICAMVAGFLAIVVGQLPEKSIRQRAMLLGFMGLAAGIFVCLPQWTFYGFGWKLTVVKILDIAGGWFLAGLVLARLRQNMTSSVPDPSS
jgi:hypothetical protein